jgi:hypothetical protein
LSCSEKSLEMARYFFNRMLETYHVPFEFECNLHAFITIARSVTFVMQREYSEIPNFKVWYQEKKNEMKNDEMLKFFREARDIIIHEKPLNIGTIAHIRKIFINSIPRGWSFVITGKGEPVWITPSGEKFHAVEFDNQIERVYLFDKPPNNFLGVPLKDFSAVTLCRLYLTYLSDLVKEAKEKFGKQVKQVS